MRWRTLLSRGGRTVVCVAAAAALLAVGGFAVRAVAPDDPAPPNVPAGVGGIVIDGDGHPVEAASVVCGATRAAMKPLVARTGADGRFEFTPPVKDGQPEYLWVLAGKNGYAPAGAGRAYASRPDAANRSLRLTLHPAGAIAGVVQDSDGKPVVGARVQFGTVTRRPGAVSWSAPPPAEVCIDTPVEPFYVARSDAMGRFSFSTVPADKELFFRATAPGMADLDTANDWVMNDSCAKPGGPPVTLVLDKGAGIRGRVVSRVPGVSAAGLRIGLQGVEPWSVWKDARTDAAGRFTLTGMGKWKVNVFPWGMPNDAPWTARAAEVETKPGEDADVVIELVEGVRVEGRVVVGPNQPAAGVGVGMYGPARPKTGAAILSATTDAQGRYRFRLPPGETYFYICGPMPGVNRLPGEASTQTVTIPAGVKEFRVPDIKVQ